MGGALLEWLPWREVAGLSVLIQGVLAVGVAVALIAATRALSIVLALTTLYDFRLTRVGSDLHARYGLLTRISRTLRRSRIQAVHQTSTPLHRLFKRASLLVDIAGGHSAGTENQQQGSSRISSELWLAPLCVADDANGSSARLCQARQPPAFSGKRWRRARVGASFACARYSGSSQHPFRPSGSRVGGPR